MPDGFQTQRNPIEGVDDTAKAFFALEQRRNDVKAGRLPESALSQPIEDEPAPPLGPEGGEAASDAGPPEVGLAPEDASPADNLGTEELAPDGEPSVTATEDAGPYDLPDEALVTLLDGSQATFHELRRGFLREGDYTRKTQELSAHRQQLQADAEQAHAAIGQRVQQLDNVITALQNETTQNTPTPQQMEQLRQTDPAEYAAVHADLQRRAAMLGQANQLRDRMRVEAEQKVAAEREARVPMERSLLQDKSPAFRKDFDAEYTKLGRYVLSPDGGGLQPAEWDVVNDHRFVLLAHKAMKYDEAVRKKGPRLREKLGKLPRAVRPGVQRDAGDTFAEEESAIMQRLKENPEDKSLQVDAWAMRERKRNRARQQSGHRR